MPRHPTPRYAADTELSASPAAEPSDDDALPPIRATRRRASRVKTPNPVAAESPRRAARKSAPSAVGSVTQRLAELFHEARWILFASLAAYLLLIFISYSPADPGWSHAADAVHLHNKGGRLGAWVSDLLFYLFGLSAYWWAILLMSRVYRGYCRLSHRQKLNAETLNLQLQTLRPRVHWEIGLGFIVLLVGSVGLEHLRFKGSLTSLPYAAGGVLGQGLVRGLTNVLGTTGSTLLLLVLAAIGASLFFGFSWLNLSEAIGCKLDQAATWLLDRQEARRDRRAGFVAARARADVLGAQLERRTEAEPVRILAPSVVAPSERLQKERQQTLFVDPSRGDLPALSLLDRADVLIETVSHETLEFTSRLIEKKLADFGVEASVVAAQPGPVITRYEIEPAIGVKGSQIVNLAKDLARSLSLVSIRVVETIPGKNRMGLELPNPRRQIVRLSEILGSEVYNDSASVLTMALGKDIAGKAVVADLTRMPHLLVAGTTGAGKSVGINAMILSLLYKADAQHVRLLLIDPKMLEMSVYEGIPQLLAPVVTDMRQAANALNWCVGEMERRYRLMSKLGVRNLAGYNQKLADAANREEHIPNPFSLTPDQPEPLTSLPMIVVVIDELADLMMVAGKKIEELIARLAQKARAAGIHLILATQRPSVDVITGLIKANIPTRIAFQVSSKIDSRTILDQMGAEALLGQGDMLYLPPGTGLPQRVHGAFVSDDEVHRVVEHLKGQGEPNYIDGILEGAPGEDGDGVGSVTGITDVESDPLYDQAVEIVLKNRRASISLVQRHLRIGYNRSARLLEQMEKSGLVSAMQSSGNREILAPSHGQGN